MDKSFPLTRILLITLVHPPLYGAFAIIDGKDSLPVPRICINFIN